MKPQRMLLVPGLIIVSSLVNAQDPSSTSLPSLSSLRALQFSPSSEVELTERPSDADLQKAIQAFQLFHIGEHEVRGWKWIDSSHERGPKDTVVYNKAVAAVVFIKAAVAAPKNGKVEVSEGAGAILAPDDLVLTNWHVTREAAEGGYPIIVYLKPAKSVEPNQTQAYSAHVEYYSAQKDLALLRFDKHPPYPLTQLKIAAMSSLVVGQDVHVIGHPQGEAWSYSTGVISQIRESYKAAIASESGKKQDFQADALQLQTAISPGNSGGPVLDDAGNIIGLISFFVKDAQNVDYAVAPNEILGFLNRHDSQIKPQASSAVIPQALFSVAATPKGKVVKAEYSTYTVYMVATSDGKIKNLVIDAGGGDVIEVWQPTGSSGFQRWQAVFADGNRTEGAGDDNQLSSFVTQKN